MPPCHRGKRSAHYELAASLLAQEKKPRSNGVWKRVLDRLGGAAMTISFDLQKARRVEKARQALKAAEDRFDTNCRPDNTKELINRIKAAERRLTEARAEVARLHSSATE